MVNWTSNKRWYLDANGKATTDESVAETLLVGDGGEIPLERAKELGLVKDKPKAKAKKSVKKESVKTEHKAIIPPENRRSKGKSA
tara:strand:+ start:1875 stop:2129 length:255 start_codon:yes stop_codon:yes gene_type:complete